jgi:RNA polymerase sigma factor (sigma-70 family)
MDGFVAPAPRPRLALPRRSLQRAGDDRLVSQIRGADEAAARAAFEVLYDRHHRGVLAFCRHMLGSFEEAEDAVQHTFSSAYRALLRDDREISLRAWLYAIARNRCLSMLSARREQLALDDVEGMLPSTRGLAREVEERSELRELLADMQRLPEDQRAALVLSELEAHSHKEIGEIIGVPPAKVKALVFQARESLMIRRQARDTSCAEIREQLSVLRGGALRRRELRRHVESCEGCRMFEAEVRRQRAGLAVLLPVAPTLALKNSTLASAFATTSGAAAGVAGISSGGAAAGLALGTKAMGMKALAVLAVAGSAGGGGYVAVTQVVASKDAPPPISAPR